MEQWLRFLCVATGSAERSGACGSSNQKALLHYRFLVEWGDIVRLGCVHLVWIIWSLASDRVIAPCCSRCGTLRRPMWRLIRLGCWSWTLIFFRMFWACTLGIPTPHQSGFRTEGSVRVLYPDKKELDRGFYDVTLLDMADELEPVMPIGDLGLLWLKWPAPVLSSMSKKQMDYEKMCQECKRRFRGAQTGCRTHCGTVIKLDMARHVATFHLDWLSCGGARCHGAINGRVGHRTV